MGNLAIGTILAAIFCNTKIPPAFRPHRIERAIAEETVKIFRIRIPVTGKILTFFVTVKGKFFIFPKFFTHTNLLQIKKLLWQKQIHFLVTMLLRRVQLNSSAEGPESRSRIACHLILLFPEHTTKSSIIHTNRLIPYSIKKCLLNHKKADIPHDRINIMK